MRKTYEKPVVKLAGKLDEVTRGAGFGTSIDGIFDFRPGKPGGQGGGTGS